MIRVLPPPTTSNVLQPGDTLILSYPAGDDSIIPWEEFQEKILEELPEGCRLLIFVGNQKVTVARKEADDGIPSSDGQSG